MAEAQNDLSGEAEAVLREHLAQLRELQRRLSADMEAVKEHFGGHARESASLARAIAEVSSEIRQLERVGNKQGAAMSRTEKVELLVDVFPTLPADEQKALLSRLRKLATK